MKIISFLSFFILFLNCKEKQHKNASDKPVKANNTLHKQLSNKLYKFDLFYIKDPSKPDIIKCEKIVITDVGGRKKIQEIKIDTIQMYEKNIYFSIDNDVNFDGQNDISLLNYEGNYNSSFSFWLFDKSNNHFKHYKGLDNIYNPTFLDAKKEICSKWHSGLSEFHLEKYFWNKDLLILKEKYEETWSSSDAKGHFKISKFENGKWNISEKNITERVLENMECK